MARTQYWAIPSLDDIRMSSGNLLFSIFGLMRENKSSSSTDIYCETVYRDLVCRERKRAQRSGQICQILHIYCTNVQGLIVPLGSQLAKKAISLLSMSVRDTDYIGWVRDGRIIGVLLTTIQPGSIRDGRHSLKTRLQENLDGGLTLTTGHSIQIDVREQD
jgi:hypothetical protein